jgi:hypothetical protein
MSLATSWVHNFFILHSNWELFVSKVATFKKKFEWCVKQCWCESKNINVEVTWFLLVGTKNRPLAMWIDMMNLTNVRGANINKGQSLDMQFAYKSGTSQYKTSRD